MEIRLRIKLHFNNLCIDYMVQMDVTVAEVNSTVYWRNPFDSICNPKQMTEYIVMDIDLILSKDKKTFPGQGAVSNKVFGYVQ